ncbi:hypothetical protein HDV00_010691 [Rhizophlyctis rosea]|nr:hypothetical protein HDV00_010691 [Rhizophlyctis rosea]
MHQKASLDPTYKQSLKPYHPALLITDYPISVLVALALVVLTATKSFQCVTKDGISIECRRCGEAVSAVPHYGRGGTNGTAFPEEVLAHGVYRCDGLEFADGADRFLRLRKTSQLGKRMSLYLVKYLGGSILGLGFSIFLSGTFTPPSQFHHHSTHSTQPQELLLGPFLPSNTARGGGIIMPIVISMSHVLNSTPTQNPAIGQFLILCGAHSNLLISSLFPTATVANPLIAETAETLFHIDFDYITWVAGAAVPGVISVCVLVPFFRWVCGARYDGVGVRRRAEEELKGLGGLSRREGQLLGVLVGCLGGWMSGGYTGVPETFVGFVGLVALLMMGTMTWEDVIRNHKGGLWDVGWYPC